jgi:hypothetical protein
VCGDLARHVDVVLHRDRHAEQRPLAAGADAPLGLARLGPGAVGGDGAECVQLRVDPLDAVEVDVHELERRDLAVAHELGLPGDACVCEVGRVHGPSGCHT